MLPIDIRKVVAKAIINLTNLAVVPTNDLGNLEFMQPTDLGNIVSMLLVESRTLTAILPRKLAVGNYIYLGFW